MKYADPALWDYFWSANSASEVRQMLLAQPSPQDDQAHVLRVARLAHVLNALNQTDDALDMLEESLDRFEGCPGVDVALLRAIRLVVLVSNDQYDEALRGPPLIQGLTPLRLEAAVFSHYAYGLALRARGQIQAAVISVARAEGLAAQMGLRHRTSILRIELARLRLSLGEMLNPAEVLFEADSRHAPTAAWGASVAVGAMVGRGEYRQAHALAMSRRLGDLPFLAALAGVSAHPDEETVGHWWSKKIAVAIRAAERGDYDEMPAIEVFSDSHTTRYGGLLNGLRALRAYRSFSSVDAELGEMPAGHDQRALWGMIRLAAVLEKQASGNLMILADGIIADLAALPYPADVIHLMERLLPHQSVLLTYFPGALKTVPALSGIRTPLLVGDTIRGAANVEMHGATAEVLIAKALGERIVINTGLVSKARNKLRTHGIDMDRMATIGHMYRWLLQISHSAEGTPRAAEWTSCVQALPSSSLRLRRVLTGQIGET